MAFVMPNIVSKIIIAPTANNNPAIGEKKVIIDIIKALKYFPIIFNYLKDIKASIKDFKNRIKSNLGIFIG
jgi:hypothetical protein